MDEIAIKIENVGKMYKLYDDNIAKLHDLMLPKWLSKFRKVKKYKEFWALKDVNLTIRKGERIALIGRNGAGKSTLLKLICGNIFATEGSFSVNGKIQALMQLGVGFHPEYTGRQNIRASLLYNNYTEKQIVKMEEEIIEFSELGDFIDQPIKTYSQGMLARLGFSTATAIVPEVLIVDEVLGAGDAYFTSKCVDRMKTLTQESGATVIFVSHDLSSVQYLCERAVLLDKGRVVEDGNTLQVIKIYTDLVRKDEEERLRVRDFKKANDTGILLDRFIDLYDKIDITIEPTIEAKPLVIRKIEAFLENGNLVDEILVGNTMDNNSTLKMFIDNKNQDTIWSEPKQDISGTYREVVPNKQGNAKFSLCVPKNVKETVYLRLYGEGEAENFKIVVRGEISEIIKTDIPFAFNVKLPLTEVSKDQLNDNTFSGLDYDHKENYKLKSFILSDRNGVSKRVFPFAEQPIKLSVECEIPSDLEECVVAMLLYQENGSTLLTSSEHCYLKESSSSLKVDYDFSHFKLGSGDYNFTFVIYSDLNPLNTQFAEYLLRLDRTYSFRVEKRIDYLLSTPMIYPKLKCTAKSDDKIINTKSLLS